MAVLKHLSTTQIEVRPGVERRMLYTDHLHMVVINFKNGPWADPDPYHQHVHEQITYIEEGELIFFCEGEDQQLLKAGDLFAVPSNKRHTIQLLSATARLVDSFTPVREDFLK